MAQILIVDDEPLTVELLSTFLKIIGHEALEALSANQTRDQLAIHTPDAILLDIMLPDENGLDLCRDIRKNAAYAELPIIIISAAAPPKTAEAEAAGATDYMAKPVKLGDLKAKLAKVGIT
jgi:DNA-binding response OmpR family regulator